MRPQGFLLIFGLSFSYFAMESSLLSFFFGLGIFANFLPITRADLREKPGRNLSHMPTPYTKSLTRCWTSSDNNMPINSLLLFLRIDA